MDEQRRYCRAGLHPWVEGQSRCRECKRLRDRDSVRRRRGQDVPRVVRPPGVRRLGLHPPEVLRVELDARRALGESFDAGWEPSLRRALRQLPKGGEERESWLVALGSTRHVWQSAYERWRDDRDGWAVGVLVA